MPFSWVQTSDVTANDRCGIIVAMAERYADDMPRLVGEAEFASSYGGSAHSVANVVAAGRLFFVIQGKQKLFTYRISPIGQAMPVVRPCPQQRQ